ncbi:MAG: TerC family protein [Candidatus Thermoplasmatota archaeon]
MLELLSQPEIWLAFATLTALEIVLGIDNVVFISILAGKLPAHQRQRAQRVGLGLAMFIRVGLLFSLGWLIGLTAPLFTVMSLEVSGRDLVLLIGGLFLVAKSTHEIHGSLEVERAHNAGKPGVTFIGIIAQILALDIVFSLDSVITAVGMVDDLPVMIAAVVAAVAVMMFAASPIGTFVGRHPTVKMLALSFLMMIGVMLVAESFDVHVPKGYIYFSMAFALGVEMLNLRLRKNVEPVALHQPFVKQP